MLEPIVTIKNHHFPAYGVPSPIDHDPATMYIGYFESSQGHQWVFLFDRNTRDATV